MKKIVATLLLATLALSCLVAAGIAGFYGYRVYSKRGGAAATPPSERTAGSSGADAPPSAEAPPGSPGEPSNLPEVYGQTRRSGSAEVPPAPPPTPSPSSETPAKQPAPAPQSSRTSPPMQPQAAVAPPGVEAEREGWKPKHGPATPYPQTRRSGSPNPAESQAPQAPKPPKGGSLGFIFESRVDSGELILRVDESTVERVPFQASSENRFRFTRQIPLAPGVHRVRVRVNLPGEEAKVRDWDVTVAPGGSSVWKVTLDRFPKQLEVKNIP